MIYLYKNIFSVIVFSILTYFIVQSTAAGCPSFRLKNKGYLLYNFICIAQIYYVILVIINNQTIAKIILSIGLFAISLTMYYVHEFRGTNINCSDILSLNTAKEVAGGYKYKIKPIFIVFFVYYVISIFCCLKFNKLNIIYGKDFNFRFSKTFYIPFSGRLASLIISILLFFALRDKISSEFYDYSLNAGEKEGYLYNFFSSMPFFHKKIVSDERVNIISREFLNNAKSKNKFFYNENFTKNTQNEYYNINRPHIIVIMNESFGFAQNYVETNLPVTPYFDNLKDVIKGNLYVNTFGGGTANTEFEFLTGMSIGNYEYPVMPYNNFVKRDKYSIARYFKNMGYVSKAFHPYTATNYHRDFVYKKFGFDDLIFFDDIKHREYVRKFISDEAFYKEVIDIYKASIEKDEKLFLFGITMQNHSGYGDLENVKINATNIRGSDTNELNSYLTLMNISDNALHILFDYFKNVDDEVIILFFGDHNASFGTDVNKIVYGTENQYECQNTYKTPFFIYNNKKNYNKFVDKVSANFLSLELLDAANLPYDELHLLLKSVYDKYSVYNFHKAYNRLDGKLYSIPNDTYMMLERKYLK